MVQYQRWKVERSKVRWAHPVNREAATASSMETKDRTQCLGKRSPQGGWHRVDTGRIWSFALQAGGVAVGELVSVCLNSLPTPREGEMRR